MKVWTYRLQFRHMEQPLSPKTHLETHTFSCTWMKNIYFTAFAVSKGLRWADCMKIIAWEPHQEVSKWELVRSLILVLMCRWVRCCWFTNNQIASEALLEHKVNFLSRKEDTRPCLTLKLSPESPFLVSYKIVGLVGFDTSKLSMRYHPVVVSSDGHCANQGPE